MRRREVLIGLATLPVQAPARAQSNTRLPTVGFVGFASPSSDNRTLEPFRRALAGLGRIEGSTIRIEARSSGGDVERGLRLISELAALPVDVFLSPGPAATRAMLRGTNIPIVAVALPAAGSEPELFSSLARPGGRVTGFSAFGEQLSGKRIQMVKQTLPTLKVLGVVHNATDPTFRTWGDQTIADAKRENLEPIRLGLTSASTKEVADHVRKLRQAGGTALIVIRDFLTATLMDDICRLALDARIAVIGEQGEFAKAGALFSYGADFADLFRRAAAYADRVLKGEKPANLPVQLPTKFELVMNVRTARALGLTIPPPLLALADEVVE